MRRHPCVTICWRSYFPGIILPIYLSHPLSGILSVLSFRKLSRLALVALGILIGLSAVLLIERGSADKYSGLRGADLVSLRAKPRPFGGKCWIFNHLNKGGGSTVKYMLQPWIAEHNVSLGLYDSPQWQEGASFTENYLDTNFTITWGAYTEGLRPHDRKEDCKWFTIFRHPIPRLVSAYYYCKKARDSLCASVIMDANEVDLLTFAEHWSNFGLRQFSLAFVLPEDAITGDHEQCMTEGKNKCPGWYKMKLYLEGLHSDLMNQNGDVAPALKDVAMYDMLKPAQELLSNKYAAVGILEEWETTLRLFNAALEIPSYDWPKGFRSIGRKNHNGKYAKEEEKALVTAWTDPNIKKFIWLDLLLYEHAVAVHKRQVVEHGLA